MSPSNTRRRHGRRDIQPASSHSTASRPPFASLFPGVLLSRMPSVFSIVRVCIYAAVSVWTIICLGIAAHFHKILLPSDLTRFVPFAIFVCCASLLLILALLGFGFWRDRNPISTRVELGCLGLAGVLWLALGAFLVSSESEEADVECFSSSDLSEPFDMPGFNTETYHAQYRVIEAFSFFNIILIWLVFLVLLALAIRHHRWGNQAVWVSSVTAYPWFSRPGSGAGKLPDPVTARRSHSHKSQRPQTRAKEVPAVPEKAPLPPRRLPSGRNKPPTHNEEVQHVFWTPHTTPPAAHLADSRRPRDRYHRDASPRR